MTKQNRLIVGGVAVALIVYYLYNQNKKKQENSNLKVNAKAEPNSTQYSIPEKILIK